MCSKFSFLDDFVTCRSIRERNIYMCSKKLPLPPAWNTGEQPTTIYDKGSSASRTCFWAIIFWWPSEQPKLLGNITRMACVTTGASEHSGQTGHLPISPFLFESTWMRHFLSGWLVGAQHFYQHHLSGPQDALLSHHVSTHCEGSWQKS
jgi:hypothetical protein